MSGEILVWWRDDDAGRDTAQLDALLALARRGRRPFGLATVPAWLDPCVTAKVLATDDAWVLQHGWDHSDHAHVGQKRIELGGTLSADDCCTRLQRGKSVLEQAFGKRFLQVLVPPWNRIDTRCLPTLRGLGFRALSTFAGDARAIGHGLAQVNTNVDLIDWPRSRRMKPLVELRAEIDRLLSRPELGSIGLLSHHLDMTHEDVTRLEQLLGYIDSLDRCRWVGPPQLFATS